MTKRELYFKHMDTGEIGQRVDVTGQSERQVEKCLRGMLINMHCDWVVMDSADDPEPVGEARKPRPNH